MDKDNSLVIFQGKKIRRTWFNDEWWFSVVDIVGALTQTDRARKYWSDLKTKLIEEGFEVSEKIGQLKLMADDGKLRLTDCANTKNMFRIIQSIPSPKAEPFKQWLAQVGYDKETGTTNDGTPSLPDFQLRSFQANSQKKTFTTSTPSIMTPIRLSMVNVETRIIA